VSASPPNCTGKPPFSSYTSTLARDRTIRLCWTKLRSAYQAHHHEPARQTLEKDFQREKPQHNQTEQPAYGRGPVDRPAGGFGVNTGETEAREQASNRRKLPRHRHQHQTVESDKVQQPHHQGGKERGNSSHGARGESHFPAPPVRCGRLKGQTGAVKVGLAVVQPATTTQTVPATPAPR